MRTPGSAAAGDRPGPADEGMQPVEGIEGSLTDLDFDADAVGRWLRDGRDGVRCLAGRPPRRRVLDRLTCRLLPQSYAHPRVANGLPAVGRLSEIGCSSRSGLRPRCAIWKEPGATASAQRAGRGMADGSLTGVEALRHQAQRGSRTMVQNCGSPSTRR